MKSPHGLRTAIVCGIGLGAVLLSAPAYAADTQAPTTPGNPRVLSQTKTSVTLTWTASTDDDFSHSIEYLVDDGSATHVTIHTPLTLTLPTDHRYTFTLRARDAAGNVSGASQVSAFLESEPPAAPPNVRVIGTDRGQPVLGWDQPADNSGSIKRYKVFADGQLVSFRTVPLQTLALADLVGTCDPIKSGGTYAFTVVAMDPSGNLSAPSAPVQVTVA